MRCHAIPTETAITKEKGKNKFWQGVGRHRNLCAFLVGNVKWCGFCGRVQQLLKH